VKELVKIFIGYDSRNLGQRMALEVCKRSILANSPPVSISEYQLEIAPLSLSDLRHRGYYWRPEDPKASTEFTYSRFLVPFLTDYQGYAIFCDSDFVWNCDITEVLNFIDDKKSVACVQHEYSDCPSGEKMDGLKQEWYPRKNWSSLMVFNCSHNHCKLLDTRAVNNQSPKYLHRMSWTKNEVIGTIPLDYNFLVGYYESNGPKALHFTDGGPWHKEHTDVPYADSWLKYLTEDELTKWKAGDFWNE
jgi:lipopolysaccharide biosynthesis glycosyltransferase